MTNEANESRIFDIELTPRSNRNRAYEGAEIIVPIGRWWRDETGKVRPSYNYPQGFEYFLGPQG